MNDVNRARTNRLANALKTATNFQRSPSSRTRRSRRFNQSMIHRSDQGKEQSTIDFRRRASTMPTKELLSPLSPPTPSKTDSMPSRQPSLEEGDAESIVVERMRTFTLDVDKAAVINRGDSFRVGRKISCNNGGSSRNSSGMSSQRHSPVPQETLTTSPMELLSPNWVEDSVRSYHVIVLGSLGVGKTSMINQFMTSDYCNPFQYDSVEYPEENTVNVLLDGEESQLTFIEVNNEKSDMWLSLGGAAYIVAYSVEDVASFRNAEQALCQLRQRTHSARKPIILVANKVDLARKRYVTTADGKRAAKEWNCKFVEIAVALGHHMDELLVGVLAQMRLDRSRDRMVSSTPGSKVELFTVVDPPQSHHRTSSGSSSGSTNGGKRQSRKHSRVDKENILERCPSIRKLDQAVSTGKANICSVGEKFAQKFLSWRRRSHSLEDLLGSHRKTN